MEIITQKTSESTINLISIVKETVALIDQMELEIHALKSWLTTPLSSGQYQFNDWRGRRRKDPSNAGHLYQQVGLIFQNSDIQPFNTTVAEELALRSTSSGRPKKKSTSGEWYTSVEIEHLRDRIPYHLSGGEEN